MYDTIERIEQLESTVFSLMTVETDIENGQSEAALNHLKQMIKNLTDRRQVLAEELAKFEAELS